MFLLFHIGLIAMFVLVFISLVLNIISIATTVWTEPLEASIWRRCEVIGLFNRELCFGINPPALIGVGTAMNCLTFILIAVAQVSHVVQKFRDSLGIFFVLGAEVTAILCLIFNTIGWYFVLSPAYQNVISIFYFIFLTSSRCY